MRIVGRAQWAGVALVLAGLTFGASAATLFHDGFNREDGPVGNGWDVAGGGNSAIASNALWMTTGGDAGREWISRDLSGLGPEYAATFDEATNTLSWRVAFTSSRDSLGGFDDASYGVAYVLGASGATFGDSGTRGYALILGNAGSPDPLRLHYFTDGLGRNTALETNLAPVVVAWNPGPGEFDGNELFTATVTYSPLSDTWTLVASTNAAGWPAAGTVDFVGYGVHAAVDELPHVGLFFNHSSGAHYSRWDEVAVSAMAPEPTVQAFDLDVVDIQETSASALWESGNGNGRLVVIKQGGPVDALPVPGVVYTPSSTFGGGSDLGGGNYVMVAGDATDEPLDGFLEGTVYHMRVFEYGQRVGDPASTYYRTNAAAGNPMFFQTAGLAHDITSSATNSMAPTVGGTLTSTGYTNPASATALFAFRVVDAGTADGLETKPLEVVIRPSPANTADWPTTLGGVTLWNETDGEPVAVEQTSITATGLFFRVASEALRIPDGDGVEMRVLGFLKAGGLVDHTVLGFEIPGDGHGWAARPEGSSFAASFPAAVTSAVWTIEVHASRMRFGKVPEAVLVGRGFPLVVAAEDDGGNVDADVAGLVRLRAPSGPGRLVGHLAVPWLGGHATWDSPHYTREGIFSLEAVADALPAVTSGPIVARRGLPAGAIGFVGMLSNATNGPDLFAFAALEWIPAGSVIYFTDNGWGDGRFRGASASDGNGSEDFLALTVRESIPPGTVVQSYDADTAYGWSTNGPIPGAGGAVWSPLAFSQAGDQVVAFVSAVASNPLYRVESMGALFQLDDTDGFEPAVDTGTGDLVPGCAIGRMALSLPLAPVWTLQTDGRARSPDDWQRYIADTNHWVAGTEGPLPGGALPVAAPSGLVLTVW
jgi:hypothetical protein